MDTDLDEFTRLRARCDRLQMIADAERTRTDDAERNLRAAKDAERHARYAVDTAMADRATAQLERDEARDDNNRLRGILAAGRDGWRATPPDERAIRDHAATHPAHDAGASPAGWWLVVDGVTEDHELGIPAPNGAARVAAVLLSVVDGVRWLWCDPFDEGAVEFELDDLDAGRDLWTWRPLTARGEVVT